VPNRVTSVLLSFFALAVVCFVLALLSLRRGDDMTAVVLCALGALSLRALRQAAKVAEGAR
jgi:hypothetical protein